MSADTEVAAVTVDTLHPGERGALIGLAVGLLLAVVLAAVAMT